ncbi:MAG: hypothetical protein R3280_12755 [Marinobacter sp.]|uniref:hypothetical protein n=1 Tax=Marinobacter sp. TaxID=50741 RepID=UPI00299D3103|nr:hypothetical protein [Marinobacter sp.]MDX1635502.1 hypothetical protein [Marinobacter sp.]
MSASQQVDELIRREGLPPEYQTTVADYIQPLAQRVADWQQALARPLILGLNGAQGTGKSTLALFLQTLLEQEHGLRCARFSLDDLYLTRAEREGLAEGVHPLFVTRGVPGTHDLLLGQQVIDSLVTATADHDTPIPAFDKAGDDRKPKHEWPLFRGPAKVVLIEGWCLGARPERDPIRLAEPVNELEAAEDSDNLWRQHVNDQLHDAYAWFFDQIDRMVMLKAPSMEQVIQWRTLQEHKLAQRSGDAPKKGGEVSRIMDDDQVYRFVMHYERVTRHTLFDLPPRADVVFTVDPSHRIVGQTIKEQLEGDWLR